MAGPINTDRLKCFLSLFRFVETDADTDVELFQNLFLRSVFVLLCMWCSDCRPNTDTEFDGEQIHFQVLILLE